MSPAVVKKSKKAAAAAATSAPKKSRAHPPYSEMINEAIGALKERTGSSQIAIAKFIEEKQKANLPANFKKILLLQLKKLVANGKLVKVKNSFKLPPKACSVSHGKQPPPPAKRKAAAAAEAEPKTKKAAKTATVKSPAAKKAVSVGTKKKTPVKGVKKKPKSIKSPIKKVAVKKAKK